MALFGDAIREVEQLNEALNGIDRKLDEIAAKGRTVPVTLDFQPSGVANPLNRPDRIGAGSGGGAGGIFGNTNRGGDGALVDANGRPFRIGGGGGNSGIFGNTGFGSGTSAAGRGMAAQPIYSGAEAVVPPGTTAAGVEAQAQAQREQTEVLRAILHALLTNADARHVISGILARNEEGI